MQGMSGKTYGATKPAVYLRDDGRSSFVAVPPFALPWNSFVRASEESFKTFVFDALEI